MFQVLLKPTGPCMLNPQLIICRTLPLPHDISPVHPTAAELAHYSSSVTCIQPRITPSYHTFWQEVSHVKDSELTLSSPLQQGTSYPISQDGWTLLPTGCQTHPPTTSRPGEIWYQHYWMLLLCTLAASREKPTHTSHLQKPFTCQLDSIPRVKV